MLLTGKKESTEQTVFSFGRDFKWFCYWQWYQRERNGKEDFRTADQWSVQWF